MAVTPTFTVGFTVAQGYGSGSLSVTLTNDLGMLGIDPSDVEVAFSVLSPTGALLRQGGVFGVAGNIHPDVSYTKSIPLPLDITGASVQTGAYTVSITMRVTGAVEPGDWRAGPTQSELCTDCIPTVCVEPQVDCITAQVTATDTTAWTQAGWTVSRTLTLKYPNGFSHADITSSTSVVSTAGEPIPSRGWWTWVMAGTATKGAVTVSFNINDEFESNCEVSACSLSCIIRAAWEEWQRVKTPEKKQRWLDTLAYSGMIMNEVRCGKDNHIISEYARTLRAELKITSANGCGCDDCDGPMVPLLAVSSSPVWTAGYGIDITGNTISLNTTVQNILGSFRLEEVVSTDGTVTVTATTPSPGVRRFDLSVTNPVEDYIEFVWEVDTNGGTPLPSLANVVNVGTFFQPPTITENAGSKSYIVTDFLTNPVDSAFTVSINMEGRALTPFMTAADRYASIMDVRIFNGQWINPPGGTQNFSFALLPIGPNLGNMLGSSQIASWYTAFLTNFAVRIKITKAQ